MKTIAITNTGEDVVTTIDNDTYTLKKGVTEVSVQFWIGFKSSSNGKRRIERGFVYPEVAQSELVAILEFKKLCLSEFDSLGVPAVKVSLESGSLSKGVKHLLAIEWLESKSETRELSREAREEESLSISRNALRISEDANKLARRAIIWSAIAALIAAIAIIS